MKKIIAILILIATMGVSSLSAQQDPSELKLRKGSQVSGFDYTYVSPWMLKSIQQKELKDLKGVPIEHVSHIEILKSDWNGNNDTFKSLMNKLSDEPGFVLAGFNRIGDKGVKICVDQSGHKDAYGLSADENATISRILIIQWAGYGKSHTVIYIVGQFTPEEVKSIFHF